MIGTRQIKTGRKFGMKVTHQQGTGLGVRALFSLTLLVSLAASLFDTQNHPTALAAGFSSGETVEVVDGPLNLRTEPGLTAEIIRVLPDEFNMTVTGGPENADGYDWYEVAFHQGSSRDGWVAGEFLAHYNVGGLFSRGDGVRVIDGRLNLRSEPGLSSDVLQVLEEGTAAIISSEPAEQDGYTWYKLHSSGFGNGWVAGKFLVFDPGVSDCEGGGECPALMEAGDGVRVVADRLNFRTGPSLSAEVIRVFARGTTAIFTGNSDYVDGLAWIEVESESYGTGWLAREFVVLDPSVSN